MLNVQLLGRPRIQLDGQPIDLPRRKSRALFYYLAAHSRPLGREHLQAFFWPDFERPAAQQSLRVAVHSLRAMLGSCLVADKDLLKLTDDTSVDVRVFERSFSSPASDLEQLSSTLELFRGDFLDGFSLADSPEFEDWLTVQRERYRRLAIRGLAELAELHEKGGNLAGALESLDRALSLDPLQEDLQRTYIRLLYLRGDRPGAIRRFESLRKLLDTEMGVPPMVETRALYDAIVADRLPTTGAPRTADIRASRARRPRPANQSLASGVLPFVGREAQMQVLHAAVAERSHRLILMEGEPGIGKTRLADEFMREAKAISLVGVAHELERTIPYQPIIEALRGISARPDWAALDAQLRSSLSPVWRAEMARLIPEMAISDSSHQRGSRGAEESRLWEGVNQFLHALALHHHLIIFLDDLHWAETSSLGMLGYLIRQSTVEPITFLAASRPVTPRSALSVLLQALTREGRVIRLGLQRLGPSDVTAITSHLSPAYAFPHGVVNLDALSGTPVVPQTIYSLVQSRLLRLSEEARRVLDAAVVLGRDFEFEVVTRVAGLSENAGLDALDELSAAGLVHALDGSRYAFDHSLTMEVAYREVSELRHRLIHRRAAEALESIYHDRLDSTAGLLAWHFVEGNSLDRAAPYAFRAGQQAFRLAAWSEAIAFFEQALAGSAHTEKLDILMALGQAHFQAGDTIRASEDFREALNLARSSGTSI